MTVENMEGVGSPSLSIEQIEPSLEIVQTALNDYVTNPTFRVKVALTDMESKGQKDLLALMRQAAVESPYDPSILLKWPAIYWAILSRSAAEAKLSIPIINREQLAMEGVFPSMKYQPEIAPESEQAGWKLFYKTLEAAAIESAVTEVTADCFGKSATLQRGIEHALWVPSNTPA